MPKWEVSGNGRFFVVKRFDLGEDGHYMGLEDGCVLQGLDTRDKYSGSYEQLAKILMAFAPPESQHETMLAYFKMIVLAVGLCNGVAHRKNFCLLYDSPVTRQGWLAPTFDQVTTTVYLPHDSMALMLKGAKRWPTRQKLLDLAIGACVLSRLELPLLNRTPSGC